MTDEIVTRFAPSPTGYLHIGGARTALFNWAYAKGRGGRFLLRIEDTDRARSSEAAIAAIHQGLDWLGLEADAAPIFQSERQKRHVEVADALLASGAAYRSFASDEEIEEIRRRARESGTAARYPGRDEDIRDIETKDFVIRFKAPLDGETVIDDQVQGEVRIRNDQLDDLVLLRSDGTPTYMLAVVVDDHDMGVSHVIRGDDHLTNCARQIQIYEALDWRLPVFAHIPLIHGDDGAKLSKRHGALGAEQYQLMGYLPEAMRNYLARLGWAHGDDEIFSTEAFVSWFDFEGMNKAPARFDMAKLDHINGHYIREMSDDELLSAIDDLLKLKSIAPLLSYDPSLISKERLSPAIGFLKERAKTLIELLETAAYLFQTCPLKFDEKAMNTLNSEASQNLEGVRGVMDRTGKWTKDDLELAIKGFLADNGLKFGKLAPALRAVLTGRMVSPGIYDVLLSLGRDEVLRRIDDFLEKPTK